ncbi:hypothetical protein CXF59_07090 [Flavobacterium sp. ALD4]|nr:hypothetical protein CXF59_07090 [Flavobacterium sp. ALD4]
MQIADDSKIRIRRRFSKTGQFLRKYKLDKLPQLFDVMKVEMNIVEPRAGFAQLL